MSKIKIPGHIQSLQPYIAGKPIEELAREKHLSRIVKLASNENPLGSSPKALEAVVRTLSNSHRYVNPSTHELVHALSSYYGKHPSQIICGAGTDALLSYMVKTFVGEHEEVLTAGATFIGIYVNTNKHNRKLNLVPLNRYQYDLDAMALAINEKTRLIYLANPNNPTGAMFTRLQFETFMARVPTDVIVILDEAYYSYAMSNPNYPNGLSYAYPNLLITRTFSKDYGLAGLRIGFAIGPQELIGEMYKVKLPFEPSWPAQVAGAAALQDADFLRRTVELNARMLPMMARRFRELGIEQVPTDANFILLLFPSREAAAAVNAACLDRGLIVRHVTAFGVPNGIRINSGTEDETRYALDVKEEVWGRLAGSKAGNLKG